MSDSWAITGLACRYPGAASASALWQHLRDGVGDTPHAGASRELPPAASAYADFGIPPIYRSSINRVQLDVLELAREALAEAGLAEGAVDAERTDVIFCTAFGMNRLHENHARVLGVELAAAYARALPPADQLRFVGEARRRLDQAFAATSHDKVGEMASSIAARIAGCFKLRGRALAIEAQDLGGIEALLAAVAALEQGHAQSVLVVGAQRIESPLMRQLLQQRLGPQAAAALCEGACALVLQGAGAAPSRVRARLADLQLAPRRPPGDWAGFVARARGPVGDAPCYWAVGGLLEPAALQALADAGDVVRSARAACGHGYAIEGLTTLIHAVLAQQHAGAAPVRALGTGLHGEAYSMVVQAAAGADCPRPADTRAPVAVLGAGARFGPTAGTAAYWDALCSAQPQFRALQGRRFRSDLYRSEDATAPTSYYVAAASFADLPPTADPQDPAAFVLAELAAQEALAALRAPAAWAGESVLVVTASNLTLEPERRLAAQQHLPRIEAVLDTLAADWQLPPAVRTQALRALHDAACLAPAADAAQARGLDQLAASGISRRIAARFGAADARCVALEAACAGSLAAIELAVDSLRSGRCTLAIVAGVELPVNIHDLCLCAAQRMLAPGLIATFTEQATGFTPGDGAGVLVLALHDEARRRDQPARALLRAVAACTESKSVIAPNPSGQIKSMQRAFEQVDYAPGDVDFIETHGTGTLIGDEVEIESLATVYARAGRPPLRLGALKAQFGHCFAAAGMASVIKTLLALQHGRLPPNHYAHALKAGLRLDERGFDPLAQAADWPRVPGRPRRAAVNAFGTGGVNVHLLLEDSPE